MCIEKHVSVKEIYPIILIMGLQQRARVENTVHWGEISSLCGKEKVSGAAVSKEGYADNLLGHKRTHYNWFPWKRCNCKQYFLLQTPLAKFILFIEWPSCVCVCVCVCVNLGGENMIIKKQDKVDWDRVKEEII